MMVKYKSEWGVRITLHYYGAIWLDYFTKNNTMATVYLLALLLSKAIIRLS